MSDLDKVREASRRAGGSGYLEIKGEELLALLDRLEAAENSADTWRDNTDRISVRLEAAEARVGIAEKRPELHRCFRRLAAAEKLIKTLAELVKDMLDTEDDECHINWDRDPPCECQWCVEAREALALYAAYRKEHGDE